MSTRVKKKEDAPLAVETVSRQPQQGRSKASLERMLGGRVVDLADVRRYLDAERG